MTRREGGKEGKAARMIPRFSVRAVDASGDASLSSQSRECGLISLPFRATPPSRAKRPSGIISVECIKLRAILRNDDLREVDSLVRRACADQRALRKRSLP